MEKTEFRYDAQAIGSLSDKGLVSIELYFPSGRVKSRSDSLVDPFSIFDHLVPKALLETIR